MSESDASTPTGEETCPRCHKRLALCVCADIAPTPTRTRLLILQHPQEQDEDLGTARLVALHLENAVFRVGLSWASLSKALDEPADPTHWATLWLGSSTQGDLPAGREIVAFDRHGELAPDQDRAISGIRGVIVLDGSWSQAKTLWWRNPWLSRLRRIAINPTRPSFYGKARREPRREALSTLESVALLMARLERKPEIQTDMTKSFARLLHRYHALARAAKAEAPRQRPRGGVRRRPTPP